MSLSKTKQKYYIHQRVIEPNGKEYCLFAPVVGYTWNYAGHEYFLHEIEAPDEYIRRYWRISEARTGTKVADGRFRESAITNAMVKIGDKTPEEIDAQIKKHVCIYGESPVIKERQFFLKGGSK